MYLNKVGAGRMLDSQNALPRWMSKSIHVRMMFSGLMFQFPVQERNATGALNFAACGTRGSHDWHLRPGPEYGYGAADRPQLQLLQGTTRLLETAQAALVIARLSSPFLLMSVFSTVFP